MLIITQSTEEIPRISQEVNALFTWLDAPRGFTLLLFWREDPRICRADEFPNRKNVNGGYTYIGSQNIIVYRKEEWDRVVLHEAIHALGWDLKIMPESPLRCWGLDSNARLMPTLFEAWTELYAEWLWCGWHNKSWATQIKWSTHQALQIYARYLRSKKSWNENTNVYAYYILKAALAPHIGFIWISHSNMSKDELNFIMCDLARPKLEEFRLKGETAKPIEFSLRMTTP